MGALTKGNVEAVVKSTKILASGLQEMTKSYAAETKTVGSSDDVRRSRNSRR